MNLENVDATTLLVGGAILAYLRQLPPRFAAFLYSQYTVSVTMDSRLNIRNVDAAIAKFNWVKSRCRRLEFDGKNLSVAKGTNWVWDGWRPMIVSRSVNLESINGPQHTVTLTTFGRSRDRLIKFLESVRDDADEVPEKHIWGSFGWECSPLIPRPRHTVIGPHVEHVFEQCETMLANRDAYLNLGLIPKKTFLLHGPPGTGKTSIVRSLASELGLPLHSISFANLTDQQAVKALNFSRPVLLLVEDIDHCDDNETSLPVILNMLDGVTTPEGIIILTANDKSKLPPVMLRPGRVDVEVEFQYLTQQCVDDMAKLFDVELGPEWVGKPQCDLFVELTNQATKRLSDAVHSV